MKPKKNQEAFNASSPKANAWPAECFGLTRIYDCFAYKSRSLFGLAGRLATAAGFNAIYHLLVIEVSSLDFISWQT